MDPLDNKDLNSLLDLDGPAAGDAGSHGEPAKTPTGIDKATQGKIDKILEDNKNLQESLRQVNERTKPLQDFYDRVNGNPDLEKTKRDAQELAKKFDIDPIEATRMIIRSELEPVKASLMKTDVTSKTERAMAEIDKEFDVDWDKFYPQITENLKKFNTAVKTSDPKGSILAAVKLAGALKPKNSTPDDGAQPPVVVPNYRSGSRPAPESYSDKVNSRFDAIGKRKKENVFGI